METLYFCDLKTLNVIVNEATKLPRKLPEIAERSEGLSGRTLRRLPFLAYIIHSPCPAPCTSTLSSSPLTSTTATCPPWEPLKRCRGSAEEEKEELVLRTNTYDEKRTVLLMVNHFSKN